MGGTIFPVALRTLEKLLIRLQRKWLVTRSTNLFTKSGNGRLLPLLDFYEPNSADSKRLFAVFQDWIVHCVFRDGHKGLDSP